MKTAFLLIACAALIGCRADVHTDPGTEKTTIVNPPAEKKVENKTTIVTPPAEKK